MQDEIQRVAQNVKGVAEQAREELGRAQEDLKGADGEGAAGELASVTRKMAEAEEVVAFGETAAKLVDLANRLADPDGDPRAMAEENAAYARSIQSELESNLKAAIGQAEGLRTAADEIDPD